MKIREIIIKKIDAFKIANNKSDMHISLCATKDHKAVSKIRKNLPISFRKIEDLENWLDSVNTPAPSD